MGFQAINFVDLAVAFAALYSSWRIHEYLTARKASAETARVHHRLDKVCSDSEK